MHKPHLWIAGCLALTAAFALAQTLPRTVPLTQKPYYFGVPNKPQIERRTCVIAGQKYVSVLRQTEASSNIAWDPSSPLPIGLGQIQDVAQSELHKLVKTGDDWQVSDFQISRFADGQGWYYSVTLKPAVQLDGVTPDSFVLLLDFSGKPGRVIPLATW